MSNDFPVLFVLLVVVLAYLLGMTDKRSTRQENEDLKRENSLLKAKVATLEGKDAP